MSDRAPYSRVYWSIHDDPKFDGIRGDARLIGSWLLLLVAADMSYPSPAYLLPTVTRASVTRLVEAGLVDLLDGHRYRIHGLDAERERRKVLATTRGPSGDRPVTVRVPDGTLSGTKAKDEAETSTRQAEAEAPRDPADIYYQLTAKFPKDAALKWVDEMTAKYGAEPTIRALVLAHRQDRSVATLLGRTQDVLAADARKLSLKDREAETARLAELRAKPRKVEPWREEQRRALEERYGDYEVYRPGDAA